jgi:hypothetical protein
VLPDGAVDWFGHLHVTHVERLKAQGYEQAGPYKFSYTSAQHAEAIPAYGELNTPFIDCGNVHCAGTDGKEGNKGAAGAAGAAGSAGAAGATSAAERVEEANAFAHAYARSVDKAGLLAAPKSAQQQQRKGLKSGTAGSPSAGVGTAGAISTGRSL